MRKANERVLNSGIYARIREARMSDSDRHNALNTLRSAELIVDTIVWATDKISALGQYFLKPSLKH